MVAEFPGCERSWPCDNCSSLRAEVTKKEEALQRAYATLTQNGLDFTTLRAEVERLTAYMPIIDLIRTHFICMSDTDNTSCPLNESDDPGEFCLRHMVAAADAARAGLLEGQK